MILTDAVPTSNSLDPLGLDPGRQGSLMCCSPWGCKESDTTEQQQHFMKYLGHIYTKYLEFKFDWMSWFFLATSVPASRPGVFKLWLVDQIQFADYFCQLFNWHTATPIHFYIIYTCLCDTVAKLNSCNRDYLRPTELKIFTEGPFTGKSADLCSRQAVSPQDLLSVFPTVLSFLPEQAEASPLVWPLRWRAQGCG